MPSFNLTGMCCRALNFSIEDVRNDVRAVGCTEYTLQKYMDHENWVHTQTAVGLRKIRNTPLNYRDRVQRLSAEILKYQAWGGWMQEVQATQALSQLKFENVAHYRWLVYFYERLFQKAKLNNYQA